VKLLVDTNVLLWWLLRSDRLPGKVRAVLADAANDVFASAVSTWEIAIKSAIGRLSLPGEPGQYLPDRFRRAQIQELPITAAHTYGVFALPKHHADPFDRLLIAQAQLEGMTIVTADRTFKKYDVRTLLVA
jgi:PIN domain nuclease of toxin-antitoxin system